MKALIQVREIFKSYGSRTVLSDVTVSFLEKQKIGVIGRNGAGKSTLMRIILGEEEADSGEIIKSRDLRLSYLEQKDPFLDGETVMHFLIRYSKQEEWTCGRMAARFQLRGELLESPVKKLPGGFQMRVKLAAMLLREPEFILLDEPTNYLDLKTLLMLENLLIDFPGGFLLISHDREFLKRTCDHTLEVDQGGVTLFPGNVEDYLEYREEMLAQKIAFNKNIEAQQKAIQSFVDRFRAKASKATLVQSRVKQLEKLEKIEIINPMKTASIRIPDTEAKKGWSLEVKDLSIGYRKPDTDGDSYHVVASGISFAAPRTSRIAILGENGQGKTTLLKTLMGDLEKISGEIKPGKDVRMACYAQHVFGSVPDTDTDVFTYLEQNCGMYAGRQEILDMAGSFLFQGDDVKKPLRVLSGGERARLILASIFLGRYNVILLDEPTNHLDFETVEALAWALKNFNGTVLFVSHDRTFINIVATEILEVSGGRVLHYPGTFEEYVFALEKRLNESGEAASDRKGASVKKEGPADSEAPAGAGGLRHQERKEVRSRLNRLETQLKKIESLMLETAEKRDSLLAQLSMAYDAKLSAELASVTEQAEAAESEWLRLEEEKEKLNSFLNQP